MTSSGKVRIYELSRDLGLDNKDVLDAAEKLAIAARSHSSSISDEEAARIRALIRSGGAAASSSPATPPAKTILSVNKASTPPAAPAAAGAGDPPRASAPTPPAAGEARPPAPRPPAPPAPRSPQPAQAPAPSRGEAVPAAPSGPARPVPSGGSAGPEAPRAPVVLSPPRGGAPAARAVPGSAPASRPAAGTRPSAPGSAAPAAPSGRPGPMSPPPQGNRPAAPAPAGAPPQGRRPAPPTPPAAAPVPPTAAPPTKPLAGAPERPPAPPVRPAAPPASRPGGTAPPPRQAPSGRPPMPAGPRPIKPAPPSAGPSKPQLVGRPQPATPAPQASGPGRPVAPSPRPQRPGAPPPIRPGSRPPGAPGRGPAGASRGGTPLELFGKPIRRDGSGGSPATPGEPPRPGAPARPIRPTGMRKPMAPGELMQLQKPSGRPTAPPPRRPERLAEGPKRPTQEGDQASVTPTATPPAPPRRPGFKPPQPAGPTRARRPDWDDSAKLEALRSRTPQKQRQKVHIIGENDDALTAETGGYAGEQEAMVLQASLARPAKPRAAAAAPKPSVAVRKRKKETTRQRQRRRAMELRAAREAKAQRPEMLVVPDGNLTVQELADRLGVESSEIIKSLFFKGIIATVTQTLDLPTIETVSDEFGVPVLEDDVQSAAAKTVEMIEESDLQHLIRRPPVVTVMGHVDHGKTSLLDAIRKTRVAAGEAGGITQHIGAYQVEVPHAGDVRKITFLDTPGHEAFTAMRARGTKVTDVAVLVVAADDGVRPQTLEAISHARAAEVPIVVAINKIDKEGSSPERVKQELSGHDLVAEDWGGNTVMVPVSAIKGQNIDQLLEMILLVSEVEDLQANPDRKARGTVIEAHLDKAKGPVATLLIQNGTLRNGDVLAAGPVLGKVRAMVDDTGKRVKVAGPSSAVEALGFSEVPTAGDEFEVYPDEKTARSVVGDRATEARASRLAQQMASRRVSLASMSGQASEGDLKELNLILKADVQGSVEAILGSLEQLPQEEVQVRVLLAAPGEITETDVDLAAASGAVIVGFNTSMASGAKRAADATGVDVRDYDVIYKLLEDIQLAMEGLLEPELAEEALGEAEVRAVFSIGKSAVAGCYITNGKVQRNCKVRVHRGKAVVYEGDLDSLRRNKDDVKEVATGFECGIGCDRFSSWQEGDRIEAYKLVTQRRTLTT
ncbi:MAG: translation initiation factor IF-2 [Cyanobacteriota bacterium]|nr:translation initiation factor IF-2 [Cyanobacteriota bacterium]